MPYDPAWPTLYAAEGVRLTPFLAAHGAALRLEHTGSTAVPWLAVKPVLDLLAGREGAVEEMPPHCTRRPVDDVLHRR